MEPGLNHTKMAVHVRWTEDNQRQHELYEGEAKMSQQQLDTYKGVIGDGLSRVSISKDVAHKDYGNGGGVAVTVTLTCDQSSAALNQALQLAHELADGALWHYEGMLRDQLVNKGFHR